MGSSPGEQEFLVAALVPFGRRCGRADRWWAAGAEPGDPGGGRWGSGRPHNREILLRLVGFVMACFWIRATLFAMIEVISGQSIAATAETGANIAAYAVKHGDLRRIDPAVVARGLGLFHAVGTQLALTPGGVSGDGCRPETLDHLVSLPSLHVNGRPCETGTPPVVTGPGGRMVNCCVQYGHATSWPAMLPSFSKARPHAGHGISDTIAATGGAAGVGYARYGATSRGFEGARCANGPRGKRARLGSSAAAVALGTAINSPQRGQRTFWPTNSSFAFPSCPQRTHTSWTIRHLVFSRVTKPLDPRQGRLATISDRPRRHAVAVIRAGDAPDQQSSVVRRHLPKVRTGDLNAEHLANGPVIVDRGHVGNSMVPPRVADSGSGAGEHFATSGSYQIRAGRGASCAHVGAYDGAEGVAFPGLRRWAIESRRERGYGGRRDRGGDDNRA